MDETVRGPNNPATSRPPGVETQEATKIAAPISEPTKIFLVLRLDIKIPFVVVKTDFFILRELSEV
jgi:hypothetical protein